jgi:hypothetical protein
LERNLGFIEIFTDNSRKDYLHEKENTPFHTLALISRYIDISEEEKEDPNFWRLIAWGLHHKKTWKKSDKAFDLGLAFVNCCQLGWHSCVLPWSISLHAIMTKVTGCPMHQAPLHCRNRSVADQ